MGEQSNSETSIRMNADGDFHIIRKNERAHFFSPKEQELILKLYEEEKVILTAKSNTTSASKLREEAWQRIADKINAVSDSGYKRTWQQVKVKHKNIVQTAKRRRAELQRNHRGSVTPSQVSAEEEGRLRVEVLPGGACMEPLSGSESSFISVSGHPVLLLPVTKTEAESLSGDETDASDAHVDGVSLALRDGERTGKRTMSSPGPEGHRRWTDADMVSFKEVHSGSFQERTRSSFPFAGRSVEKQSDDIRALYCSYLRKEMENRDQQMAFRALKMKKLEKEILLLDKQLM